MTISGNVTIGAGGDGNGYAIINSGTLTSSGGELNKTRIYGTSGSEALNLSNAQNSYINLGSGADTATFDSGRNLKIM